MKLEIELTEKEKQFLDENLENARTGIKEQYGQTIEEYLKSEDMQQVEKQLNEKYKGIHTIKLKAEDNKLIYEYTMDEDIGEDFELVKLSLERQLQQGEKDSEAAAYSLKDYVLVENPCIIIRYCTKDGTVITEKEYTSLKNNNNKLHIIL